MDARSLGALAGPQEPCQACDTPACALLLVGARFYCQPCAEWLGLVPLYDVRTGEPEALAA